MSAKSESVPFCKVSLQIEKVGKEIAVHKTDLDTNTEIRELKIELKEQDIIQSENQVWYLDGTELRDEKTLGDYEITGANKIYRDPIRIVVKVD